MRWIAVFVAGVLVGVAVHTTGAQSQPPVARLNHVGIAVPSVADALTWYSEKMGFREVMRQTDPMGKVTSVYLQISRDTFVEIQEANAQRPVGITHWGLEVADIKEATSTFRQRGITTSNPSEKPSAYSGGYLANVTDLAGLRVELSEQPPEGKLRQAAGKWTGKW